MSTTGQINPIHQPAPQVRDPHHPFLAGQAVDTLALTALLGIVAAFSTSLAIFTIRPGMPTGVDWWMILLPLLPSAALGVVIAWQWVAAKRRAST